MDLDTIPELIALMAKNTTEDFKVHYDSVYLMIFKKDKLNKWQCIKKLTTKELSYTVTPFIYKIKMKGYKYPLLMVSTGLKRSENEYKNKLEYSKDWKYNHWGITFFIPETKK